MPNKKSSCQTATIKNNAISRQRSEMKQNAFGKTHVIKRLVEMSKKKARKRIKIKGHYMQVRQRSTNRDKKGTIMGKWKPKKRKSKK